MIDAIFVFVRHHLLVNIVRHIHFLKKRYLWNRQKNNRFSFYYLTVSISPSNIFDSISFGDICWDTGSSLTILAEAPVKPTLLTSLTFPSFVYHRFGTSYWCKTVPSSCSFYWFWFPLAALASWLRKSIFSKTGLIYSFLIWNQSCCVLIAASYPQSAFVVAISIFSSAGMKAYSLIKISASAFAATAGVYPTLLRIPPPSVPIIPLMFFGALAYLQK